MNHSFFAAWSWGMRTDKCRVWGSSGYLAFFVEKYWRKIAEKTHAIHERWLHLREEIEKCNKGAHTASNMNTRWVQINCIRSPIFHWNMCIYIWSVHTEYYLKRFGLSIFVSFAVVIEEHFNNWWGSKRKIKNCHLYSACSRNSTWTLLNRRLCSFVQFYCFSFQMRIGVFVSPLLWTVANRLHEFSIFENNGMKQTLFTVSSLSKFVATNISLSFRVFRFAFGCVKTMAHRY